MKNINLSLVKTPKLVISTAIALLLLGLTIPTQATTKDWSQGVLDQSQVIATAKTITSQVYPNADEVVVDEFIHEEYQADGTYVLWDDEYLKVLTEKGRRSMQTRSLHYMLPYGTAEYTKIEIIKPNGTVLPVDIAKQSRVMTDTSQMGSNIYNPKNKIFQVTLPGLEINDLIHLLSTRNIVKARAKDMWSSYEIFEYTAPIKRLTYVVIGPKSRPLKNIRLKDPVAKTVEYEKKEQQDSVRHQWQIKDVPRMFAEPQMPELHTVVQRLLISTIADWKEVSTWYWKLCEPHLKATTPALHKKTQALTQPAKTREDKIRNIFRFVSQEIRYMGITTEKEAPGYEPHDVKLTFENRYGVCRDKAALLVAMLRLAKIEAFPVLIMVGPKKDEEVPQPYFNHAIVAVLNPDQTYTLMDPTDENTKELLPAYLCNRSYLVARPQGETLLVSPIVPADKNLVKIKSSGEITDFGTLRMESTLFFEGINDSAYRGYFSRLKPLERKMYFEGVIKKVIAGSKVTQCDIQPADLQNTSQPLTVRLRYEADDFLITGQEVITLKPPILGSRVGFASFILGATGLKKRKYPLHTEIACGVEETFDIALPANMGALISLPTYTPIEQKKNSFHMYLSVQDHHLQGRSSFKLSGVEFSPQEYQDLKQTLKDIEYSFRKKPIFLATTKPKSAPDIRILDQANFIELHDEQSWTVRYKAKKKILTYAGKKANSELKFSYNPIWSKVTLKKARVISAQGKINHVVEAEINIMDAAWAGSAPRYPAAKTMVVSLPAVEIGSIIEYETLTEHTRHPFFSWHKAFGSYDPIDQERLELRYPKTLKVQIQNHTQDKIKYRRAENSRHITHTWKAADLAPIKPEDYLPPLWSFQPNVFISTGDWPAYTKKLAPYLEKAVRQQSATRQKAREITANKKSQAAKVIAIRDFVAKQLRPTSPALTELPFSFVTPADQTLNEGYGNNVDQAVVLHTMLTQAGFQPEFILVSWSSQVQALRDPLLNIPGYGFFYLVLVRVQLDQQWVYLNDTDQYAHLGSTQFHQRLGLPLSGEPFMLSIQRPWQSRTEKSYHIVLAADGSAEITRSDKLYGMDHADFCNYYAELPPEERNRHYQELAATLSHSAVAKGKLITDYTHYPGQRKFTVRIKNFAVRSGKHLYFNLPQSLKSILSLRSDERKNPLYSSDQHELVNHYTIQLPSGYRQVLLMPQDLTAQAPAHLGKVEYTAAWGKTKQFLNITQRILFAEAVISPEHYPQLIKLKRHLDHPKRNTIMLEMK